MESGTKSRLMTLTQKVKVSDIAINPKEDSSFQELTNVLMRYTFAINRLHLIAVATFNNTPRFFICNTWVDGCFWQKRFVCYFDTFLSDEGGSPSVIFDGNFYSCKLKGSSKISDSRPMQYDGAHEKPWQFNTNSGPGLNSGGVSSLLGGSKLSLSLYGLPFRNFFGLSNLVDHHTNEENVRNGENDCAPCYIDIGPLGRVVPIASVGMLLGSVSKVVGLHMRRNGKHNTGGFAIHISVATFGTAIPR